LKDGASDQDFIDYTNDYKSRFTVAKSNTLNPRATSQKKIQLIRVSNSAMVLRTLKTGILTGQTKKAT
jgi:hypothetical protein